MTPHRSIIVVGGMNTDIVGLGVERLLGSGELTLGGTLHLGPGGKSCNVARMISTLVGSSVVAFIGKTSMDPFGLWKVPVDALEAASVRTDFLTRVPFEPSNTYPGIALIPVDCRGENQIYVLPGVNATFEPSAIDAVLPLFHDAAFLVLSLEIPMATALHAVRRAKEAGVPVFLDPGGMRRADELDALLEMGIFLLKPNEQEIKLLTGVVVCDAETARDAARMLCARGVEHVFLTLGAEGAFLMDSSSMQHIPVPLVPDSPIRDATGCGDQTLAALCAYLWRGSSLTDAARLAVVAGTLEFGKRGVVPITAVELAPYS